MSKPIKLERRFGRKAISIFFTSVVFLITTLSIFNSIFTSGIIRLPNILIFILAFMVALSIYGLLVLVILNRSLVRLTEDGIWQLQIIRAVFIQWEDVQEIGKDANEIGVLKITSYDTVIRIDLEDFRDWDKLSEEIVFRVPKSAIKTKWLTEKG